MVMCSQCHKRMAVIFVTKMENGEKSTKGLCLKCAKEMGVPVDNLVGNVMGQFGISPEQLEGAEDDINAMLANTETPSDADDNEDGGAPAIDLPKLFRDAGLFAQKFNNNRLRIKRILSVKVLDDGRDDEQNDSTHCCAKQTAKNSVCGA